MSSSPKVSAVLTVYNGEQYLQECLDSLVTQTMELEIILVDDGSTDETVKIAKTYKEIKLYQQSHQGPALARNLGASYASGKVLLFVDADMVFAQDYAYELTKPIIEGQVIGTYTVEEKVKNWDNIWARCCNIEEGWEDQKRFPKSPPKYGTDYRAILKSKFEQVGGFDNIGYTDTWSLFSKLGQRPLATHAICYHNNPDSLRSVYKQAKWVAKRPYKLGVVGSLLALLRTSLPASLLTGLAKSLSHRAPAFLVFKIVYDLGRFVGILELLTTGKLFK